jgi:hypothetical protein
MCSDSHAISITAVLIWDIPRYCTHFFLKTVEKITKKRKNLSEQPVPCKSDTVTVHVNLLRDPLPL